MKKCISNILFCLFLFSAFVFLINTNDVMAAGSECDFSGTAGYNDGRIDFSNYNIIQVAKSDKCRLVLPLCSYKNNSTQVIIDYQYNTYYHPGQPPLKLSSAGWFYVFKKDGAGEWTLFNGSMAGYESVINTYIMGFGDNYDGLYCPQYITINPKKNMFGIDKITGSDTPSDGALTRVNYGVFAQVQALALQSINEVDYSVYSSECSDFKNYIITKTKTKVFDYYEIKSGNTVAFLNNYMDDQRAKGITYDLSNNKEFVNAYDKKVKDMFFVIKSKLSNGEITNSEYEKLLSCSLTFNGSSPVPVVPDATPENGGQNSTENNGGQTSNGNSECKSLLGGLTPVVENILRTVQYAGPVLVGIFTIIDFVKAATSDDSANLTKKNSKKFVKRLVAAALLFFIPLLVNLIFGLVGITAPNSCLNI